MNLNFGRSYAVYDDNEYQANISLTENIKYFSYFILWEKNIILSELKIIFFASSIYASSTS